MQLPAALGNPFMTTLAAFGKSAEIRKYFQSGFRNPFKPIAIEFENTSGFR
jgi:hypothetical protein